MKTNKYIAFLPAAILAVNTLFFVVAALILPLGFEENDDVMMAMIANGSYSGTPDCHLVYINVIYGAVLAFMYSLTTSVEWYTLSFAILHIISASVLSYCVLTTPNRAWWERVLWLIALYVLWARIIIAFQFTTTAGMTCLAGCTLLLRKESHRARWTGVLLIVIAALVRFWAAGLVGVLMAPIIVYTYRWEWKKYGVVVAVLMAVVACRYINRAVYDSDPEWRYFREYNLLRAKLNDNPNAYRLTTAQLPEGIDPMDYQLLLRFVQDAEQIDLYAIRRISAAVGELPLRGKMDNLYRMEKYAVEMAIILILLILMIITTGNRAKYIFLILYTVFVAALMVYVSLDGFLKNRVFLCMLFPLLITDFMLLPNTTGLKRRWGIGIAIMTLCGWYGYQMYGERTTADFNRYVWTSLQRPLLDFVPADAYVTTIGTSMMTEAADPWCVWPYQCRKYTLGWMTWSPLNKPVGHSYRALLDDKMYIFTDISYTREHTALQRVREQIEKHYGVTTEIAWTCRNGRYALVRLKICK